MTEMTTRRTGDGRNLRPVSGRSGAAAEGEPGESRLRLAGAADRGKPARQPLPRLRVIVADPDPLARRAIRDALLLERGFVVPAEAKDGVEVVELALHYRPELVLMEVAMPLVDGITACAQIVSRAPSVRVVMFSVPRERETELRALRSGASGFLSKSMSIESVGRALRSVASGEAAVSRSLTSYLIEQLRYTTENGRGMRPVKSPLTTREWEVLDLICAGDSTREISAKLFLSEDTVYSHTKSILRKLGVHSRAEAVEAAGRLRQPGPA
ncbi:MAG: response regulator transcription factor [Solirubrobacteraceae bacterium]|jgi:DNA-binding NarL/FixJ family response regulator